MIRYMNVVDVIDLVMLTCATNVLKSYTAYTLSL